MSDVARVGFEAVNSSSHLFAAAAASIGAIPLVRRAWHSRARAIAVGVFVTGVVLMFTMSGVYHSLPLGETRATFRRLDHAAIFFLIAATFTPFIVEHFRDRMRKALLFIVWLAGASGMVLKLGFFDVASEAAGLVMYLSLGWSGLVVGLLAARRCGIVPLLPMLWGGLAYTAGALLEFVGWPVLIEGVVGPHELFHVYVIAAVAFHWSYFHDIVRPRGGLDARAL